LQAWHLAKVLEQELADNVPPNACSVWLFSFPEALPRRRRQAHHQLTGTFCSARAVADRLPANHMSIGVISPGIDKTPKMPEITQRIDPLRAA